MSTITTRAGKGSELTWAELDANFTALNTDKLQPDANGNLGLGVTPTTRLDIAMPAGAGTPRARVDQVSDNPYYELQRWTGTGSNYNGIRIRNFQGAIAFDQSNGATIGAQTFTQAMTLDASGNLLVGTTALPLSNGRISTSSPNTNPLRSYVSGTSQLAVAAAVFEKADNNTTTSNIFAQFTINAQATGSGQINANGANQAAFGSFSDSRLKENIVDLPPQLDNILALRPVEFDYIESEGGGHQISFIAQEVEQIYPDAVGERSDGMKTLTGWSKTEARLVKAIQEQQALITSLRKRLTALEAK